MTENDARGMQRHKEQKTREDICKEGGKSSIGSEKEDQRSKGFSLRKLATFEGHTQKKDGCDGE